MEIYLLFPHEFFQDVRAFIVQALELWTETSLDQSSMDPFVCIHDGLSMSTLDRFSKNVIAVVVVQHKDVVIPMNGCNGEAASLIAIDLAFRGSDVDDSGIT